MSRKANVVVAVCVLAMAGSACGNASDSSDADKHAAQSAAGTGSPALGGAGKASVGAGGSKGDAPSVSGTGATGGAAGAGSMTAGSGGMMNMPSAMAGTTGAGTGGTTDMVPSMAADADYNGEAVMLTETLVIPAGKTVHVGPGTTFTAGMGMKVQIEGTLIVEGTADSHVKFLGANTPRSWDGIVIKSGGVLQMKYAEIGGATYGISAEAGSMYTVDYSEIGTSFKVAVLYADGSFDHMKFHASGDDTFSPVNEVSADDVNGSLTIIDASPTVSNSSFDNSSPVVDMIRIGGMSSPVFDHVSVTSAHCGFHTNGGVNNSPTIKNSELKGMSYGIMAYTSKAKIDNCNFIDNTSDVGFCFDATADNAPSLTNNFYSNGNVSYDASCFEIGVPDPTPASAAHDDVGPVGL